MVIKNRDSTRLNNCLESLKNQIVPCKVILVDYGSDTVNIFWERELVRKFNSFVNFIEVTRNTETFNKCRALNIGLRKVDTKYILSTDIDIIFAPNFIQEVISAFEVNPKSIVLCQKMDLDRFGTNFGIHEPSASGSCIAIERDWINKVHGYDEFYTYWGREDNDLVDRAISDGYKVVWITDKTQMYHQWHEPASQETLNENTKYYQTINKPLVRNLDGWGEP